MKVLMLTTHLNTGGITSYLFVLTKEMIKKGHEVYIASNGGNMEPEFSALGVQLVTLNIRTKSILSPRIYGALPCLVRLIKEKQIDVIHAHTRITQVMGRLLDQMTGKPYLSTCHGYFKPKLSRRVAPCWGRVVIAISPAVKTHLEKDFGVEPERVALIKSGIDINDFPLMSAENRQAKRKEWGVADGPVIGIIARLSDVKGHAVLIDAMPAIVEKIPDVHLMIVGEGKMEGTLKQKVADLSLQNNVTFYPVVNQTAEVLPLFDIFVMPSISEGLGLSVMEAQAAGLPVVASRVGGIPALIKDGETGVLFESRDSAGLAKAVVDLLQNPEWAKELGACARAFVAKEFSVGRMAAETLGLYKRLTASS